MKGPSLQRTAAVSAVLHLLVFLTATLLLKQTTQIVLPSPYVVNLVDRGVGSEREKPEGGATVQDSAGPVAKEETLSKSESDAKIDEKRIDDMVSAIARKREIGKIVELRRKVLSIKGGERQGKKGPLKSPAASPQGVHGSTSYENKIRDEIHKQWFWPDIGRKDLEAVIAITIRKDGSIPLENIVVEKPSSSRLFTRYAVEAIAKASPVTPPPYGDFSIGLRFYP